MQVNIVGRGDGWQLAPDGPHTWGINDLFLSRKLSMACEMHDLTWDMDRLYRHQIEQKAGMYSNVQLRSKAARKRFLMDKLIEKVNEHKIPLLSVKKYDFIPTSIEYPLEEIIAEFKTDYFSCGIAYMIAYAIYKGAKKIDLFGVCMYTTTEYVFQKPGVEFWCGIAIGNGIEINVCAPDGAILQTRNNQMYGKLDRETSNIHYQKYRDKGLRGKGYQNLAFAKPDDFHEEPRQYATRGEYVPNPRLSMQ